MKLWLLGDVARRGRAERTLSMRVDGALVGAALEDTTRVTSLEPPLSSADEHAKPSPAASSSASSRAQALAAALQGLPK